jgi:hypothetical protein
MSSAVMLIAGDRFFKIIRSSPSKALAEVAIGVIGEGPIQAGRLPTDAEQFARTITAASDFRGRVISPIKTVTGTNMARSEKSLAEAECLTSSITNAGLRAGALTAMRTAAARLVPARSGALLTEAEPFAPHHPRRFRPVRIAGPGGSNGSPYRPLRAQSRSHVACCR